MRYFRVGVGSEAVIRIYESATLVSTVRVAGVVESEAEGTGVGGTGVRNWNEAIYVPHRTAPHRTVPYRTVPYRTVPYRTVPYRRLEPPTASFTKLAMMAASLMAVIAKKPNVRMEEIWGLIYSSIFLTFARERNKKAIENPCPSVLDPPDP